MFMLSLEYELLCTRRSIIKLGPEVGDDVLERIRHALSTMSPGYQSIAVHLVEHQNEAAFFTAAELAHRAGVSHATVVRFARYLGFTGYPALVKAFQGRITRFLTTVERLQQSEEDFSSVGRRIMRADAANLNATIELIDLVEFERAVAIIAGARRVFVAGFRSAAAVAHLLSFSLQLIRGPGEVILVSATDYLDQLTSASQTDALVAISFPRYYRQTVEVAAYATEVGLRRVAITDHPLSPLGQLSEATLCAQTKLNTIIESFTAPVSVVNALVAAAAVKAKPAAILRLAEMETAWDKHNIYHVRTAKRWSDDE